MDNKTNNILIKVFIVIAVVTFALAIKFSIENEEQAVELEKSYLLLKEAKDSISNQNEQLQSLRIQANMWRDSLQNALMEVPTASIPESTKSLIKRADNSQYVVTLHSLMPDSSINRSMLVTLISNGYSVVNGTKYNKKPDWMSNSSTVLFYTDKSKTVATEIASLLTRSTGVEFKLKRGAGLGVKKGEEAKTFFVHYVNTSKKKSIK